MNILITDRQAAVEIDPFRVERSLGTILKALGTEDREVSLVFEDDKGITEINREYLGRNRPTNIIAFSMDEGQFGNINPSLLGDIIISTETALRDAQAGDLSFEDELDYLMIHGILHLLGYDHQLPNEAEVMANKEREIFFALKKYHLE